MEKIEIGGYFFEVDKFVAEHIKLLEGELDDSCRSVVEKSERIVKLEAELERLKLIEVEVRAFVNAPRNKLRGI